MMIRFFLTSWLFWFFISVSLADSTLDEEFKIMAFSHAKALTDKVDDKEKFEKELLLLAERGHKESQFLAGILAKDKKLNIEKVLYWLGKSDEQGCAQAATMIGFIYLSEKEKYADENKGIFFIKKAADKGEPLAMQSLARILLLGENGVKADPKMAYSLLFQIGKMADQFKKPWLAFSSQVFMKVSAKKLSTNDKNEAEMLAEKRLADFDLQQSGVCNVVFMPN